MKPRLWLKTLKEILRVILESKVFRSKKISKILKKISKILKKISKILKKISSKYSICNKIKSKMENHSGL
jgi:peptidoglycan hydrolase CwlO-like protein